MDFDNFSIGTDIEDIERFKDKDDAFLNRVFTENEIQYCNSNSRKEQHFAARFCAKEAVVKALSAFDEKLPEYNKIEIYHNEKKVPQVRFLNNIEKKYKIKISLSHDKTKAIAYVIMKRL